MLLFILNPLWHLRITSLVRGRTAAPEPEWMGFLAPALHAADALRPPVASCGLVMALFVLLPSL